LRSWLWWDLDLDGGRASLYMEEYDKVWKVFFSLGSFPSYISLGGPLGPPNTVWLGGTLGSSGGQNSEEMRWFWRFLSFSTHDMGSDTTRMRPYGCSLKSPMSAVKLSSFPHMDSVFIILRLVELVWTRATTPFSWICILGLW
jgi:hypothetical protein